MCVRDTWMKWKHEALLEWLTEANQTLLGKTCLCSILCTTNPKLLQLSASHEISVSQSSTLKCKVDAAYLPAIRVFFFLLSCGCCKQISLFGSCHNDRWNLVVFHSTFLVYSPTLKTFSPRIMNSTSNNCQLLKIHHQVVNLLRRHNKAEPGYLSFHKHPFLLIAAIIWQQDCYKYMNKNHKYTTQHVDNGLSKLQKYIYKLTAWQHKNPSQLRTLK